MSIFDFRVRQPAAGFVEDKILSIPLLAIQRASRTDISTAKHRHIPVFGASNLLPPDASRRTVHTAVPRNGQKSHGYEQLGWPPLLCRDQRPAWKPPTMAVHSGTELSLPPSDHQSRMTDHDPSRTTGCWGHAGRRFLSHVLGGEGSICEFCSAPLSAAISLLEGRRWRWFKLYGNLLVPRDKTLTAGLTGSDRATLIRDCIINARFEDQRSSIGYCCRVRQAW